MTKEELWKIYIDKNPDFAINGANLTADGLKKFFDKTYDIAHKAGFENGKSINKNTKKEEPKFDFNDLLNGFKK